MASLFLISLKVTENDKNKIINLKIQNKKQKRKAIFWRISTCLFATALVILLVVNK